MTHHPTLYRTRCHGCWAGCSCSWTSRTWTSTTGAHLDFGQHLIAPPLWLPDLSDVPLRALRTLPLDTARAELLARISRPVSTIAGSEGS